MAQLGRLDRILEPSPANDGKALGPAEHAGSAGATGTSGNCDAGSVPWRGLLFALLYIVATSALAGSLRRFDLLTLTLVHAAATAGIDLIDVPFLDLEDMAGLEEEARRARELGMTGKGAIHPKQLEVITRAFTPTEEEVAEARRIVSAFEAQDRGLVVVDGKLIEKPVILRMQRILSALDRDRQTEGVT